MPIVLKILWFYLVTHPKTALLHFFSFIKFKTFFFFHKVLENQIQVFEEINGSLVLQNESNSVFGFFFFFSSLYYLFHWVYKYKFFFFFFLPLVYCVNYEFVFLFFFNLIFMNRSWVGLHCHWSLITYTGRNMRLRGFGVHIFGHVVIFSLFYYYISFYYLIWFESVRFSFTLMVLKSNVEDESLPPMWLYLYLGMLIWVFYSFISFSGTHSIKNNVIFVVN